MFALVVRFELRDQGAAARFDKLAADLAEQITAGEPGTLAYITSTVEGEPLARIFYEVYANRAAFDAHNATDHVRHFLAARQPLLTGRRVEYLTPQHVMGLTALDLDPQ